MENSNFAEFSKIIGNMAIVYEKELAKEAASIYFDILKEYEIGEIKKGAEQHLKTSKYFPKPAELALLIQPSLLYQKNEFGY